MDAVSVATEAALYPQYLQQNAAGLLIWAKAIIAIPATARIAIGLMSADFIACCSPPAPFARMASLPARKGECRIPICNIRAAQRNLSEEIEIFHCGGLIEKRQLNAHVVFIFPAEAQRRGDL